ncbi:MAG: hypothetical protein ACXWZE_05825 [Candidatus Binatia bacterium]
MLYESERGDFSLLLLGDVMPTRRLAVFGEAINSRQPLRTRRVFRYASLEKRG